MKTASIIFLSLCTLLISSVVVANGAFFPTPTLSSLMAQKPDLPAPTSKKYSFLEGLYGAVRVGASSKHNPKTNISSNVTRTSENFGSLGLGSFRGSVGAAAGFMFREAGLFNRIELEYMHRGDFDYNGSYQFEGGANNIIANIRAQTLMGKVYSDLPVTHHVLPYVMLAGGGYFNRTGLTTGLAGATTSTNIVMGKKSTRGFAWGAGAGVRFRLNKQFMVDVGYEYDYLGKSTTWTIPSTMGSSAGTVRVNDIATHNINASIMLQPWGTYTDEHL